MRLALFVVVALSSVANAKPTPVVVGATLPDFGCLGWSDKLGVAACVVGSRGNNIGESTIAVVFVPVRDKASTIAPRDKVKRALDDQSDSISGYQARVYVVEGTLIVERTYSTGDEGIYGSYGTVWRCTKAACDEPLE